jgi:hypothetical protein
VHHGLLSGKHGKNGPRINEKIYEKYMKNT